MAEIRLDHSIINKASFDIMHPRSALIKNNHVIKLKYDVFWSYNSIKVSVLKVHIITG